MVHADKESGYKHLSVPLVNIRWTMNAANIDRSTKLDIVDYARCMFYADREWQTIFNACDVSEEDQQTIQDSYCDIKEADSLHLCHYIAKGMGTIRPPIKKKTLHAHYGFAAVFENNDRKMLHGSKVIRKYQTANAASNYDRMNSRNRALALELCKIVGIEAIHSEVASRWGSDLTTEENDELTEQEMMLNKAGEWIVSRCSAADVVRSINDFLRISGRYETTKENIL
jgi:hypothetical protein